MFTRGSAGSVQQQRVPAVSAAPAEVDAAIATVLAAEQAARASIAEAGQQAEQIVAEGRVAARRIAERGAQRAAAVHDALQRRLQDGLAAIESERLALQRAAPGPSERRVAAAARALALELTTSAGP
jgi:vacuolar-type H+-ATPase subunit H